MQHFQTGLWLAIVSTALFSFKAIFIKLAYTQGVDTVTLLSLRMLVSLPFYLSALIWALRQTSLTLPSGRELASIISPPDRLSARTNRPVPAAPRPYPLVPMLSFATRRYNASHLATLLHCRYG